jgi:hypothetical protein
MKVGNRVIIKGSFYAIVSHVHGTNCVSLTDDDGFVDQRPS